MRSLMCKHFDHLTMITKPSRWYQLFLSSSLLMVAAALQSDIQRNKAIFYNTTIEAISYPFICQGIRPLVARRCRPLVIAVLFIHVLHNVWFISLHSPIKD